MDIDGTHSRAEQSGALYVGTCLPRRSLKRSLIILWDPLEAPPFSGTYHQFAHDKTLIHSSTAIHIFQTTGSWFPFIALQILIEICCWCITIPAFMIKNESRGAKTSAKMSSAGEVNHNHVIHKWRVLRSKSVARLSKGNTTNKQRKCENRRGKFNAFTFLCHSVKINAKYVS